MSSKSSSSEEEISESMKSVKLVKLESVLGGKKISTKEEIVASHDKSSASEQSETEEVCPAGDSDESNNKSTDSKVSGDSVFDEEISSLEDSDASSNSSSEVVPKRIKVSFHEPVVVFKKTMEDKSIDCEKSDVKFVATCSKRVSKFDNNSDSDDEKTALIKKKIEESNFERQARFFRREVRGFFSNNPVEYLISSQKRADKRLSAEKADLMLPDLTAILSPESSENLMDCSEPPSYAPSPSTGARPKIRSDSSGTKPIVISPLSGAMPIVISPSTGARSKLVSASTGARSKVSPKKSSLPLSPTEAIKEQPDSKSAITKPVSSKHPHLDALLSTRVETTPLPILYSSEAKEKVERARALIRTMDLPRDEHNNKIFDGFTIKGNWLKPCPFNTDSMRVSAHSIQSRIAGLREVAETGTLDELFEALIIEFEEILHDLTELSKILGIHILGKSLAPPAELPDPWTGEYSLTYTMIKFYNLSVRRLNTIREWTQDLYNWCSIGDQGLNLVHDTLESILIVERNQDSYRIIQTYFRDHNVPLELLYFGDTYRLVHAEVHMNTLLSLLFFLRRYLYHRFGPEDASALGEPSASASALGEPSASASALGEPSA